MTAPKHTHTYTQSVTHTCAGRQTHCNQANRIASKYQFTFGHTFGGMHSSPCVYVCMWHVFAATQVECATKHSSDLFTPFAATVCLPHGRVKAHELLQYILTEQEIVDKAAARQQQKSQVPTICCNTKLPLLQKSKRTRWSAKKCCSSLTLCVQQNHNNNENSNKTALV